MAAQLLAADLNMHRLLLLLLLLLLLGMQSACTVPTHAAVNHQLSQTSVDTHRSSAVCSARRSSVVHPSQPSCRSRCRCGDHPGCMGRAQEEDASLHPPAAIRL
jgi:hypothetical protein